MTSRSTVERAGHARARLESEANVWVATASPDGVPHLVPLSLAWINGNIVVTTPADTPTARNAAATGLARVALDSAADVVVFDTDAAVIAFSEADRSVVDRYVERVGWDPGAEHGEWVMIVLTLRRGQAWNSPAEISDRTIIRRGAWLG